MWGRVSDMSKQETTNHVQSEKPLGMLMGRFEHALDPKRRLTVPSGWFEVMGAPRYVYVIPDPNSACLTVLAPAEMEARLQALQRRKLFDPKATQSLRTIGENSEQLMFDVQRRIRVSDRLLQYAGLTGQVVMIGAVNRIELWAPDARHDSASVDQAGLSAAFESLDF